MLTKLINKHKPIKRPAWWTTISGLLVRLRCKVAFETLQVRPEVGGKKQQQQQKYLDQAQNSASDNYNNYKTLDL